MKLLSIALVLVAFAGAVHAETPGKPWTEADVQAKRDMHARWLIPALDAVNAASALSSTDPAGACAHAKEAQAHIETGRNEIAALEARLRVEGKDLTPLNPLHDAMTNLAPSLAEVVRVECAPREAGADENDPEAVAMDHYMQRYGAAIKTIQLARSRQDQDGICAGVNDAGVVLDEMIVFLEGMKAKYRKDSDAVAQLDAIVADTRARQVNNRARAPECPATAK